MKYKKKKIQLLIHHYPCAVQNIAVSQKEKKAPSHISCYPVCCPKHYLLKILYYSKYCNFKKNNHKTSFFYIKNGFNNFFSVQNITESQANQTNSLSPFEIIKNSPVKRSTITYKGFLLLRDFLYFFLVMGKYYNTKPNNHSSFAIIIKKNKCELLVQSKPRYFWSTWHLCSLLLTLLPNEGFVDVGNDTSSSNCCLDQRVQLLITTDGQLQVTGSDALHLQVFGGVARQL